MKRVVLAISSLRMGGAERVLTLLANHLAHAGCEVRVLTWSPAGETAFFPLDARVRVLNLGLSGVSGGWRRKVAANLRRIFALRRALRAARPDAVVSFMDATNVRVLVAAWGTGIPVFVSERTNAKVHPLAPHWKFLRRLLYPRARAVVVPNEGCASYFRSWLPQVRVIPNPVPDVPPAPAVLRVPSILAVGRLARLKGYDLLVRAFADIHERLPGWTVTIAGEGEARAELEALIARRGLQQKVHLKGATRDPGQAMREASVFVLPSRVEGFPNALCEAMAHGMAVVATDCEAGPREILTDGVDGILVPVEDVGALAAALLRLAREPETRARMGARAAAISSRYSAPTVFAAWDSLLAGVAGND
ncbi:MAG: glycosyltransferase [Fibrobacteria bacterium]|jgi:glycosyltransferase involved in cell wall biosynthesis|nr:glycosyltransferase [Fibrobacteria bacterium]